MAPDLNPVVFDLGNVLIGWDPHPAIAAEVGDERASRFLADDDFDFSAWNHAQDAGRGWDEAERVASVDFPQYADEIVAYRRHFDASLLGTIDGTEEIVRELHAAGIRLYALTNWSAELFGNALRRFDVLHLFDDIVVSGQERVAKPDPAIYAALARRAGRPLRGMVFVDDTPRNVAAAREADLDAVVFTTPDAFRSDLIARGYPLAPHAPTAPLSDFPAKA
ncbi:2-haloacid dehalogenase [Mumia flava]|uniref:2-haloacid dehalogenase n=1 Tax=Mumia flava TaxID=1348852 RepID=A0A0B2BIG0_9ACTN|nr:HAD family phosphatase [Mumia flava]PJJ58264.1 2-haloacid dehalogenase [Mumia flava]